MGTFEQRSKGVQLVGRPCSVALLFGKSVLRERVGGDVETALLPEDIEQERGRTKITRILRKSRAGFGDGGMLGVRRREELDVGLDERWIPDRLEGLIEERKRLP